MAKIYFDIAQPFRPFPYRDNQPEEVPYINDRIYGMEAYGRYTAWQQCPLALRGDEKGDEWWELPIEPVVTVSGKNNITTRSVLKVSGTAGERRGTVKELWSQDDYEVNIAGVFIGGTPWELPESDIRRLRNLCERRAALQVRSAFFTLFGITRIAVEEFQFPFTKGMENQMFSIRAVSDDFDRSRLLIAK